MRTRLTITKTTTALATSALLVLGLAACGGSGSDEETPETTASEESAPAEEETTEETTEEEPEAEAEGASGDVCAAIDELTGVSGVDTSDPAAAVQAFEDISTAFEAAEPPADLASDWDYLTTTFRTFTDTMAAAAGDPANADVTALSEATTALTGEEFMSATTNIATYGAQNC
ncbi:hypothetical protein V5D56_07715 [Cellulosimicrobium sp. PMB13]|uniref:hypothetical protein n=1 Tax=Cellulosimicrobium sp. PMB13 TaxID=3120158 RepID=UPI003F4BC92C